MKPKKLTQIIPNDLGSFLLGEETKTVFYTILVPDNVRLVDKRCSNDNQ